jgi:hypothetical protein
MSLLGCPNDVLNYIILLIQDELSIIAFRSALGRRSLALEEAIFTALLSACGATRPISAQAVNAAMLKFYTRRNSFLTKSPSRGNLEKSGEPGNHYIPLRRVFLFDSCFFFFLSLSSFFFLKKGVWCACRGSILKNESTWRVMYIIHSLEFEQIGKCGFFAAQSYLKAFILSLIPPSFAAVKKWVIFALTMFPRMKSVSYQLLCPLKIVSLSPHQKCSRQIDFYAAPTRERWD